MSKTGVNWIKAVSREHSPLFIDFFFRSQDRDSALREYGADYTFGCIHKNGLDIFISATEFASIQERIPNSESDQFRTLRNFAELCEKSSDRHIDFCRELAQRDECPLIDFLNAYDAELLRHGNYILPIVLMQSMLDALIREKCSDAADDAATAEVLFNDIQHTSRIAPEAASVIELLKLARKLEGDGVAITFFENPDPLHVIANLPSKAPQSWLLIEDYVRDFGWSSQMYFRGDLLTEWETIDRVGKAIARGTRDRLAEIANLAADASGRKAAALDILRKQNRKTAEAVDTLTETYLFLRSYRLDAFFIGYASLAERFAEIGAKIGIDYCDIPLLTMKELKVAVSGDLGQSELRKIADSRRAGFEVQMLDGVTAWTENWQAQPSDLETADSVSGIGTFPGIVSGDAFVLLRNEDRLGMPDEAIIVTSMTTPSLMVAVEKASGIVTDEGGILSHAAIVSRELGIPCVIGTGNATRVFRTGERVTLDSHEGTVRRVIA
jgi:phosphohistidine swiveling domain-containing protein